MLDKRDILRFNSHRTIRQTNRIKQQQFHAARKGEEPLELTKERLEEMAAVDVRTVDVSTLTDLRNIEIDTSLPVPEKLKAFARQTNNVYVNRIGEYVVKVRFRKNGAGIDEKMAEYLQRLSEIHI